MTIRPPRHDLPLDSGSPTPSEGGWLRALMCAILQAAAMFHGPEFPADPGLFDEKRPQR